MSSILGIKSSKEETSSQNVATEIKDDIKHQLDILKQYMNDNNKDTRLFILSTRHKISNINDVKELNATLNDVNKKIAKQFKERIKENLNSSVFQHIKSKDLEKYLAYKEYKTNFLDTLAEVEKNDISELELLFLKSERGLRKAESHLFRANSNIHKFPDYEPPRRSAVRNRSIEEINREDKLERSDKSVVPKEKLSKYTQDIEQVAGENSKKAVRWKDPIEEFDYNRATIRQNGKNKILKSATQKI